jgi:hypothetical protein
LGAVAATASNSGSVMTRMAVPRWTVSGVGPVHGSGIGGVFFGRFRQDGSKIGATSR